MRAVWTVLLAALILTACQSNPIPGTPPTATLPGAEGTVSAAPTRTGHPPMVTRTLPPQPPTALPDLSSTAAPMTEETAADQNPLRGLIYELPGGNGVFQIDGKGQSKLLSSHYQAVISADLQQELFSPDYDGEIWLANLPDGAPRNVTQTPDRIESGFQWWLSNPNWIVFTSQKTEEQGPSAGMLSTVKVDGSDYQVLETESSIAAPAPGPDGMTIAYDRAGLPYLWVMGKGAQPVDLTGLPKPIRTAIAPAWSPDGLKLAWKVWGQDGSWSAVAVQDLTTQEWTLLHEYQPQGGTDLFADLAWSTNGKWIATVNQGEAGASKGSLPLWVLPTTGGEEHYIGNGTSPVWSPDSSALVFYYQPSQSNSTEESRLTRVQLDTWQLDQPDLPVGAQPREWHGTGDDFH